MKTGFRSNVRHPAVAGQFYLHDKEELSSMIDGFLAEAKEIDVAVVKNLTKDLKALIVPHAGYIFSGIVAASGYKLAKNKWSHVERVFILGSSHHVPLNLPCQGSFNAWNSPLGEVTVKNITQNVDFLQESDLPFLQEHSIEVQLPFLQKVLKNFTITPILLNYYSSELTELLSNLLNEKSALVVSSDLSHFFPYEKAVKIDKTSSDIITRLDVENAEQIDACGLAGIQTVMELGRKKNWQVKILDYRNSGDTFGDKARVVGYGCYGFFG